MFDDIRRRIGKALEKVEDRFKNVITLGKHDKIKEHVSRYNNTLALLDELNDEHEELIIELKDIVPVFEKERADAFEVCKKCQAILVDNIKEISISFPDIKTPPRNDLSAYMDGVFDTNLQQAYKSNNVGLASKGFLRYVATHRSAQQQLVKHPLMAVGVALIDGINGLVSATQAASAQLKEIVEIESRANGYVYRYRDANGKLLELKTRIEQDSRVLTGQLQTLERVKAYLIALYQEICLNPSKFRKVLRWLRKLFRMNIYTKKELKKLDLAKAGVNDTLANINIILQKTYDYDPTDTP